MSTNSTKWTSQQRKAIDTIDRDVLVTASAGTGKTAVLSERCVNILSDSNDPTDVSGILVLTFTEAAAEEMLSRIAAQLRSIADHENSAWLRRQLLLLDAADISTIDSFCKRLVTENFHALGIDPTFTIIDPDEQKLLKSEILEKIIEDAWQDPQLCPALAKLLNLRSIQSSGSRFLNSIITASQFLDSLPSRDNWHNNASTLASVIDVFSSDLAQKQKEIILEKLNICDQLLEHALNLDARFADSHWADWVRENYLSFVNKCADSITSGNDDFVKLIIEFKPPRFKVKPKTLDKEFSDIVKEPIDKAKEIIKKLADLAIVNPDYDRIVSSAAGLQSTVILELVKRFDKAYADAKRKLNTLDFADLEHQTLRLLEKSDTITNTLQQQYRYIFVDEYQDINALQQAILARIARDDNTFVVGDIKQSIYAFRQAQPKIFLDRLQRASDDPADNSSPLRVDLSDNFRSRKGVLDFVNTVFKNIMTSTTTTIDYDQRAFLNAGFPYEQSSSPSVELNIIDETASEETSTDNITIAQRQAVLIAQRIKTIMGSDNEQPQFQVYDKQTDSYRGPKLSDIVILMRSPSSSAGQFIEILRLEGIDVSSQSSSGYFDATEIADILGLLKVLDNPHRDIDLAAVLRSPLFNYSETDLAKLRCYDKLQNIKRNLFCSLTEYAQTGPENNLQCKACETLEQISNWRQAAQRKSLADLIWEIYRKTHYLSFVGALPNGSQRRSNLLKFHDRAIQFESFAGNSPSTSLSRFVEFIEKILDQDQDWAPAQPETETENAVRIMSVHRSKGLEFPIVFLADLQKRFNQTDSTGDCLFDSDCALGLRIVEPNSRTKVTSIAHQVIAEKKHRTMIAEEMRILYVALTRARERLILVGSKKSDSAIKLIRSASLASATPLPDFIINSASSHFDWVLSALACGPQLCNLFDIDPPITDDDRNLYAAVLSDQAELNYNLQTLQERTNKSEPDDSLVDLPSDTKAMLNESLTWQYPFIAVTDMPAKTSVSMLTHPTDEFAQKSYSEPFTRTPKAIADITPTGRADRKLIGTATHLIIENLDLNKFPSLDSIQITANSLIQSGYIPQNLQNHINYEAILSFFGTDIGQLAFDTANKVFREWPFTFGHSQAGVENETTIVQGIIDMLIKTPQGLVIIDFKTDNVATKPQIDQRTEIYQDQLKHYADAAQAILKTEITGAYLYFLQPAELVTIDR